MRPEIQVDDSKHRALCRRLLIGGDHPTLPFFCSYWSAEGIKQIPSVDSELTVCETNHFTSFAVLIKPRATEVRNKILQLNSSPVWTFFTTHLDKNLLLFCYLLMPTIWLGVKCICTVYGWRCWKSQYHTPGYLWLEI